MSFQNYDSNYIISVASGWVGGFTRVASMTLVASRTHFATAFPEDIRYVGCFGAEVCNFEMVKVQVLDEILRIC